MAEILDFNDGRGKVSNDDTKATNEALAAFVFSCGKCGNTTFQLMRGGAIRCAHCNQVIGSKTHFDASPDGE